MQKRRLDLNRYKKIYPLQRRSPYWYTKTNELAGFVAEFSNSAQETVITVDVNTPIVTLTPENENVQVWIDSINRLNSDPSKPWVVTIKSSSAFTGKVHVHVIEASV